MDWEDEFDNWDEHMSNISQRDDSIQDGSGSERDIDPLDIANPANAYFFLSDDAQDEINGRKRKNMKCRLCGHRFAGEFYESCPECYSVNTEGTADEKDDGNW